MIQNNRCFGSLRRGQVTLTKTIQRVELGKLVRTDARPTDARVTEVFLTDSGREAIASVRRLAGRVFDQAFDGFVPSELEALNVTLRRIFANLANVPD
jgi:DNA-binding MarR family transcriptional regulator